MTSSWEQASAELAARTRVTADSVERIHGRVSFRPQIAFTQFSEVKTKKGAFLISRKPVTGVFAAGGSAVYLANAL